MKKHIEDIKALLSEFTVFAHQMELKGDSNWTYEIKKRLGKLGEKNGYQVCASGFKDWYNGEWLFDLVWYKEEGEGESARMVELPLVLESEWNKEFPHIKYDFEKLLASSAKLRIMICYAHLSRSAFLLNYFNDAIEKYRQGRSGDTYLIAMLDYDTEEFRFDTIVKS